MLPRLADERVFMYDPQWDTRKIRATSASTLITRSKESTSLRGRWKYGNEQDENDEDDYYGGDTGTQAHENDTAGIFVICVLDVFYCKTESLQEHL